MLEDSLSKLKIYVVGYSKEYANWMLGKLVNNIDEADLVVFTGGEDVDPSLYNQDRNPRTSSNLERDIYEKSVFEQALKLGKPMVGICRGSQFLCVMAGGQLVQHQQNPLYVHNLLNYDGDMNVETTSTHHQAQYPYNLPTDEYKILGWTHGLSKFHEGGRQQELYQDGTKECEVVYYKKINALGIQGHPESMFGNERHKHSVTWFQSVLNKFKLGVYKHMCTTSKYQSI